MPRDDASPLDVLQDAFDLLTRGPLPLSLDLTDNGHGLPARPVPLDDLRSILLHPSCGFAARDAVVAELVARARSGEEAWTIGLAGVLLPRLRRTAGRLARDYPGDTADLDAEVLTGLLDALTAFDTSRRGVASRLLWAAYRYAARVRRRELRECGRHLSWSVSAAPPRPWGHPDLVLARAVEQGVICGRDAELIGATRIGDVQAPDLAGRLGIKADTLRKRRRRAELQLAEWLQEK